VRLVETYREKNGKEEKEEERKTKTLFLSLSTAPIAAMCDFPLCFSLSEL